MTTDAFEGWSEESVRTFLLINRYGNSRRLPDGSWAAQLRLLTTHSVCMGVSEHSSFEYRWCFADPAEAQFFLENAQAVDDVPQQRVSLRGHRYHDRPLLVELDENGFRKW